MTSIGVELVEPPEPQERVARHRPPVALVIGSGAIALCFCAPFIYLVMRNIGDLSELGQTITSSDMWRPLGRSILLASSVTCVAVVVAVSLAWLTIRTDLPGARMWRFAAPVPLILPSFIAATALLAAFARGGLVAELLGPLGVENLPEVRGFWGSLISLSIISYPYVFLPLATRLETLPPAAEEASRLLGANRWETFLFVLWPQIRGAVRAGALLVFLYSLSDFGVVALLDYPTLTVRIFSSRLADTQLAFALAMVLGMAALAVTVAEQARNKDLGTNSAAEQERVRLGRWRWPALGLVSGTLFVSAVGPVAVLAWWVYRGFINDASGFVTAQSGIATFVEPTLNTILTGISAGALAIVVTLPVAYLTTRYKTKSEASLNTALVAGFALPGLVVALSVLTMTLRVPFFRPLRDTLALLIFAYVIHFGAQAYRSAKVGVSAVDLAAVEAARTMGASRFTRLWEIEFKAMIPALRAGAGLVMLSTMKELPATLLLKPLGFDTLSSRIWNAGGEGFLAEAGLASLVLLASSSVLSWFLVLRPNAARTSKRR